MGKQNNDYTCHNIERYGYNFNLWRINKNYLRHKYPDIKLFFVRLFFSMFMFVLFSFIATSSFASVSELP